MLEALYDLAEASIPACEVMTLAMAWYPDWPVAQQLQLAEDTVAKLVRDGLVELRCDVTVGDQGQLHGRLVAPEDVPSVLGQWRTWLIPEGGWADVCFWATVEGKEQYQRRFGAPFDGSAGAETTDSSG
jgi:hypothetical protein